jgi:hypothetical protein
MPLDETRYFWRVKAFRSTDTSESEYSAVWSFNADTNAPDAPALLAPADSSKVIRYTPGFLWSQETKGSPVFYTLQVADDSLFPPGPEFYEYTHVYDTSLTVSDTLTDSTLYYWRVKASDEAGHESDWQDHPFRFTAREFLCGDANADGVIDIADVVRMLNYVYKSGPAPEPLEAGDVNVDGAVDIGDIVYLLNYLFKGWPAPDC